MTSGCRKAFHFQPKSGIICCKIEIVAAIMKFLEILKTKPTLAGDWLEKQGCAKIDPK